MGVLAFCQCSTPATWGCAMLAELSPLHVVDECIKASLLNPRRLISARASGSLNMRGLGLPGWGLGGDGAHLPQSQSPWRPRRRCTGHFVQPGSHSHPIRKSQTCQFHRVVHTRLAPGPLQRGALPLASMSMVRSCAASRVHAKQKGAGEGGDEGHGTIIEELPSIFSHDDTFLTHPRRTQDPGRPSRVAIRGARRHRGRGHGLHRQQVH